MEDLLEENLLKRHMEIRKVTEALEQKEKLRKLREERVVPMPNLDEEHLFIILNHIKTGEVKRLFCPTDTFQQVYDWIGSLYHEPEYFELLNQEDVIYPIESVSSYEDVVLLMKERNYPLSNDEDDTEILLSGHSVKRAMA